MKLLIVILLATTVANIRTPFKGVFVFVRPNTTEQCSRMFVVHLKCSPVWNGMARPVTTKEAHEKYYYEFWDDLDGMMHRARAMPPRRAANRLRRGAAH